VSAPILFYNQLAFTKAGLNAAAPPTTLPQMLADAKALKASGSGMGLVLDPWHLETWLASANQLFVNNNNAARGGLQGRLHDQDRPAGLLRPQHLVRSGDATTNPSSGPDEYDNLLGIGSGKYAMTIDSSADLGTVEDVLGTGSTPT